jgi:hypothetical protein
MPGEKMDPEEGQQFLRAATNFAQSKGVKVTTEAGGGGKGESGRWLFTSAGTVQQKRKSILPDGPD